MQNSTIVLLGVFNDFPNSITTRTDLLYSSASPKVRIISYLYFGLFSLYSFKQLIKSFCAVREPIYKPLAQKIRFIFFCLYPSLIIILSSFIFLFFLPIRVLSFLTGRIPSKIKNLTLKWR